MLGTSVVRKEDADLLTVGGTYVDDVSADNALHAAFVRSMVAHGEIRSIDTSAASEMPGGVAISTADDFGFEPAPPEMPMFNQEMTRTRLATGRVRFVGEPVAVVVADTAIHAIDAAEAGFVDVDPLEPAGGPRPLGLR
jgi:carbon-monoxide dehydrogenase large subunit